MKICLFFLLTIGFIQFSCKKSDVGDSYPEVQIHYMDKLGKDLYPNNGYNIDSLKTYDLHNGIEAFLINGYKLSNIFPSVFIFGPGNNDIINGYVTTIIHLKMGLDDTLIVHLTGNSIYGTSYDGIWYNNIKKLTDTFTISH